jgi:hypothetical protein
MRSDKISIRKKPVKAGIPGGSLKIACKSRSGQTKRPAAPLQIIREQSDKLNLKKRRLKAAYDLEYLKDLII